MNIIATTTAPEPKKPESDHDPIRQISLCDIHPSPENDQLYRPVDPGDPNTVALADDIKAHGLLEPLVVTSDLFIVSGHRRHAAAQIAGLDAVPCRVMDIRRRAMTTDEFVRLVRAHNLQRVKSLDEMLREEIVSSDPTEAYQSLIDHRRESAIVQVDEIVLAATTKRAKISRAKDAFLAAAIAVMTELREFWPLSVRGIHYLLLNNPPLIHSSKPASRYANKPTCYKALVDLLARARFEGSVPFEAIHDPTRPVTIHRTHAGPQSFIRQDVDQFLKGYWRDLQQSQPNHIEIVGEKNTLQSIIKPVAGEYCIPLTIGRGFSSLPPREAMMHRFEASGKPKLVILIVSDFDPEGDQIAHSFARSMRDDFFVRNIVPVKVALTRDQVQQYHLPAGAKAKKKSTNYARFIKAHGSDDVFELEALQPADLQQILRDAIDSVLDKTAFNAEIDAEAADAAFLDTTRQRVKAALASVLRANTEGGAA